MRQVNIGCIVMAAGSAMRFGTNKLKAVLDGKSLILRALEAVPRDDFGAVTVVTQYPEIRQLAQERGFTAVVNTKPELGLSHTIALGLFRANQIPPEIQAIVVEKPGLKVAGGAIGIGEITSIPTAPAIADAYFRLDGERRLSLPLDNTPYARKK